MISADAAWIFYASAAVWAGLGIYVCVVGRRAASLERRIQHMEHCLRLSDTDNGEQL